MRKLLSLSGLCVFSLTAATFNFDSTAPGTSTPFSLTDAGVTAAFSSPADPGGFQVGPAFFDSLTGNVLLSPGPANANNIPLTIAFSAAFDALQFKFALNTNDENVPLSLDYYSGGLLQLTTDLYGGIPTGFSFPEGALSSSGQTFDKIVLHTPALNFAIDDLQVSTYVPISDTPEPASMSLLLFGTAGLIARRVYTR